MGKGSATTITPSRILKFRLRLSFAKNQGEKLIAEGAKASKKL